MSNPLVSVIIPTYNRGAVLKRAIKSVIDQSYKKLEVLIVDDGSTNPPKEIVSSFNDNRLQLINLEKNQGAAYARNIGAKKASGEFVAFLDSDDEWLLDYIERRVGIHSLSEVHGSYGACKKMYDNNKSINPSVRELRKEELMINYLLSGTLRAVTSSLFIRRESFLEFMFKPNFVPHEDYVFCIEFSRRYNFYCDQSLGTIYHVTENSLSSNHTAQSHKFLRQYKDGLDFKWLMHFILRKSYAPTISDKEDDIKEYSNLLKMEYSQGRLTFKNVLILLYLRAPKLVSIMFNYLVESAYTIKKLGS